MCCSQPPWPLLLYGLFVDESAAGGGAINAPTFFEGLPGTVAFLAPESPQPTGFPTVFDAALGQFTNQTAFAAIEAWLDARDLAAETAIPHGPACSNDKPAGHDHDHEAAPATEAPAAEAPAAEAPAAEAPAGEARVVAFHWDQQALAQMVSSKASPHTADELSDEEVLARYNSGLVYRDGGPRIGPLEIGVQNGPRGSHRNRPKCRVRTLAHLYIVEKLPQQARTCVASVRLLGLSYLPGPC